MTVTADDPVPGRRWRAHLLHGRAGSEATSNEGHGQSLEPSRASSNGTSSWAWAWRRRSTSRERWVTEGVTHPLPV
ncbi:hypothetical protein C1701_15410 [Actinoalloteichus sp. AHMU CJ021]|nr:hypothetical protein C1701_15410 [Actinoalloteichus sp. AHMU CJ021]